MKVCPCKGCELRKPMCRVGCKSYDDWRAQKDEENALIRKNRMRENLVSNAYYIKGTTYV